MAICPKCGAEERVKNGIVKGRHRHRCRHTMPHRGKSPAMEYGMKATSGILGLVVVLGAIGPKFALAEPPPSSFDINFSGDAAIWNPFDGFLACESLLGATLCLELDNMVCNGKGSCAGDAEFSFSGILGGSTIGPAEAKASCKPSDNPVVCLV